MVQVHSPQSLGQASFGITVTTLTGKNITLRVCAEMDILGVKGMIMKKEGIHADQQKLLYQGKQLQEG